MDLPVVRVWQPVGSFWRLAAMPFSNYTSLDAELRHLDIGSWSMELEGTHPAVVELESDDAYQERLITIDWRNFSFTGLVTDQDRSRAPDGDTFTVGGVNALGLLNRIIATPDPSRQLVDGLVYGDTFRADRYPDAKSITAPAEEVVRHFIAGNVTRWQAGKLPTIQIAPSLGRGDPIRGRARMQKLWRVVRKLARRGNLGVRVFLKGTSDAQAALTIDFYVPVDRSSQAKISEQLGTLRSWEATQSAPDATYAIVGDAGWGTTRSFYFRVRDTPASWGGYIEDFINASDTFDPVELRQRGDEALDESAGTATFSLVDTDSSFVTYGNDYNLGDTVLVKVGRHSAVDKVTAVHLTVDDTGVTVAPVVGNPNKPDPLFQLGQLISKHHRRSDFLETQEPQPLDPTSPLI